MGFTMYPFAELFGRTIGMYPLMALAGALAAGFFACREAQRRGPGSADMLMLLLVIAAGMLVGGSLLYGATNARYIAALLANLGRLEGPAQFFQILAGLFGGSVFYGGLIGGTAAGMLHMRRKKLDIPLCSDILAPAVPLFHAFGRIGCFLGGCCYGVECEFGFVFSLSPVSGANGVRRFPVQLLEAGFNLLLFFLLWRLYRRGKLGGRLFALYLALYSVGRFFLESLRGDAHRGFVAGLSTSQWISIALAAAVAVWALRAERNRRRGRVRADG